MEDDEDDADEHEKHRPMLAEGSRVDGAHASTGRVAAAISAIFLTFSPGGAGADEALARAERCDSCHAPARKVIGPSYAAIAERYRGRPEAAGALAAKIRQGGAGAWGAVPMPANTQVDEAEARRLVAWILSRPTAATRP